MRAAAVQTTATPDPEANLGRATELVEEAAADGAELVVLPEYFAVAGDATALRAGAEGPGGPVDAWAGALAGRLGLWLVAGSVPEAHPGVAPRLYNTSSVYDPTGTRAASYRKIHPFDAPGAGVRESDVLAPGNEVCTIALGGAGPVLGVTLCYDLRFPELYLACALAGATVVAVPAAFTAPTGRAHWEVLVRARAIETGTFIVAADQVGPMPVGMPACHGHSLIVDPWGTIVADAGGDHDGFVTADLDPDAVARARRALPVLSSRRPDAYRLG
jgi:predicted amidohydrolase